MNKMANVSWEGQEYVPHDKNAWWYVGLVIVGLALAAFGVWRGWWSFVVLVAVSAVALIVYSVRPPRKIKYEVVNKGIKDGDRLRSFDEFKAFGVINDDGHYAIVLTPRKRFSPRTWIYFPEEHGEQIVDAFGMRLPMEQVKLDVFDRVVRLLRI